jgi:hypothetical protein
MKKKSHSLIKLDGTSTQGAMRREEAQAARVVRKQRSIRRLRGIVVWEGDLKESRLRRTEVAGA